MVLIIIVAVKEVKVFVTFIIIIMDMEGGREGYGDDCDIRQGNLMEIVLCVWRKEVWLVWATT